MIASVKTIFRKNLEQLRLEIASYKSEQRIWYVEKSIANSAGNLCLHLVGNLNTYLGAQFGNTGYIRQRDLEFSLKDIPQSELLIKIDETIRVVEFSLDKITPEQLQREYPMQVFAEKITTEYFLIHLAVHLTYHLGQINYHRRLLDKQ